MKLNADRNGTIRRFSAKLGWREHFDTKEIEMLSAGAIPMLIAPSTVQGRRNNVLQYDISAYSTLEFYLTCILSREQFAELLLGCTEVFGRMQQLYLNFRNLVLELDKVYIQLNDRSIHFIYLPLMDSRREASVPDFFRQIVTKTVRSTYEQSAFLDACLAWLDRPASFVLSEFATFVRGSVFSCAAPAARSDISCGPRAAAVIPPNAFYRPQAAAPASAESVQAPPQLPGRDDLLDGMTCQLDVSGGDTVLLGEDAPARGTARFYLLRLQTGERVELTHFPFLVGTERGSVSYCVTGNAAVSRRHAEFTLQDGECAVCDQRSTNKTYVNDCALVPSIPQLLKDGDELRLGNERFRFVREERS